METGFHQNKIKKNIFLKKRLGFFFAHSVDPMDSEYGGRMESGESASGRIGDGKVRPRSSRVQPAPKKVRPRFDSIWPKSSIQARREKNIQVKMFFFAILA